MSKKSSEGNGYRYTLFGGGVRIIFSAPGGDAIQLTLRPMLVFLMRRHLGVSGKLFGKC